MAVNRGLFLVGLSRSTPMNPGLVMALIPIFTFVVAAGAGQETFSPLRLVGVLLALAGIAPLLVAGPLATLRTHGKRLLPETGNVGVRWSLGYILVFPTLLCYLLNMFAMARLRASTVAVYVYAQPPAT